MIKTFLSFALLGSQWVLWLLVILSVVSIAVVLEKIVCFYRIRTDFELLTENINRLVKARDFDAVAELCRKTPMSPACHMIEKASLGMARSESVEKIKEGMYFDIARCRKKLDDRLIILGTLGNNAPFIGLLGTVLGVIRAFHDLGADPGSGSSVVMAGISEALVATAVGLLVAIPAVVFFNWFKRLAKNYVGGQINLAQVFISKLD